LSGHVEICNGGQTTATADVVVVAVVVCVIVVAFIVFAVVVGRIRHTMNKSNNNCWQHNELTRNGKHNRCKSPRCSIAAPPHQK